jgi:hypothetical protein
VRLAILLSLALGALVLAAGASASKPATTAELKAMMRAGFETGPGSFIEWARISTRDGRYAVFYAKRCQRPSFCGSHIRPTYGFLLHRRTTAARSHWLLLAQASLHPPYRPEVARLCRAAPKAVRRDLLAGVCL